MAQLNQGTTIGGYTAWHTGNLSNPAQTTGATFTGAVTFSNSATFSSSAAFNNPVTFGASVTLSSGQTLTNNGTISGGTIASATISNSTLSGTITNSGTISGGTVSGATISGGTFSGTIAGAHTLSGAVTLSGGATFSSGLTTNTATITGNAEVDGSLYFKASNDNSDTTYATKEDPSTDVSYMSFYIGDNGAGTALGAPTSGAVDYFVIKSTNLGVHHYFGTDGSAAHAGNLVVNGAVTLNGGGTIASGKTLTNNGTITGGTINASSVPWTGVSSHPTTVSGYGITDAITTAGGQTISGTLATTGTLTSPTFSGDLSGYMIVPDTRSVNDNPQDFASSLSTGFKSNTTNSLSDGGTYNGIITLRRYGSGTDFSGGPVSQLGFTDNGNIWMRTSTGATTWGSWYKMYHSGNLPNPAQTTGATFTGTVNLNSSVNLATSQTFTNNGTITGGAITNTTLSGTITNSGTISGGTINATSVPWSGVSSHPTTISGYGITDALAYTTGATFSGAVTFNSTVSMPNTSLTIGSSVAGNVGVELGSTSTAGTPFIDFHSSGSTNDYDARIIASGGTSGTIGAGVLTVDASQFVIGGSTRFVLPVGTNLY